MPRVRKTLLKGNTGEKSKTVSQTNEAAKMTNTICVSNDEARDIVSHAALAPLFGQSAIIDKKQGGGYF